MCLHILSMLSIEICVYIVYNIIVLKFDNGGCSMNVRDVKVSDLLHECLVALISDGVYPADLLTVDEVHWLKVEFGEQLKKCGPFLFLEV